MYKTAAVVFLTFLLCISSQILPADQPDQDQQVFARRRAQLMTQMGSGIAVFRSPQSAKITSFGTSFRQSSNIYYLTGMEEPESALILIPGKPNRFILFIQEKNLWREMWNGKMVGTSGAKRKYGADLAFPLKDMQKKMERYLWGKNPLYCDFGNKNLLQELISELPRLREGQMKIIDIAPMIHEMRIIKTEKEIALMEKAARITADALVESMKATRPGMVEYQIEGIINYVYQKNGCKRPGFRSIVASGPNAAIMHYTDNNRKMVRGDLLLMDIGAEYGYYGADVTRTIPVSGTFNKEQKKIYGIVLEAQKKGIQSVAPGKGIQEVIEISNNILKEGLFRLGLITDKQSRWQAILWLKYLQSSHWLGLDTHDVGDYRWRDKRGRILESGMVLTIEPGIYIGENDLTNLPKLLKGRVKAEELQSFIKKVRPAFERYKNISIRIEDDILVTKKGCRVLSKDAPKEIKDVEKIMARKSRFK